MSEKLRTDVFMSSDPGIGAIPNTDSPIRRKGRLPLYYYSATYHGGVMHICEDETNKK